VPALDRFTGTRVIALPRAIDAAVWPEGTLAFRLAPDEVLVTPAVNVTALDDPHAIVELETGFSAVWLDPVAAIDLLERECDWELPRGMRQWGNPELPIFAQGLVAGLPVKIWFERDRVLFIVASPLAADLTERLR
jgi:hypothetical protein